MPKDNIERAIKKGTGAGGEADNVEEALYEGYGPGKVAILVEILTDNRNRTAGEIRKIFDVNDGELGKTGCASFNFDRKGLFVIPANKTSEEQLMEVALEAGAEDIKQEGDKFEILHSNKLAEDDMCMATPAIVGDKLVIRAARRVYCIQKGAKPPG